MKIPRGTALILVVAFALHTWTKIGLDKGPDMLWACHVTTLLIAVGIALRSSILTAIGFVFHAGIGLPAYIVEVALAHETTWTSIFIHGSSIVLGGWAVRGVGWPWWTPLASGAIHPVLMVFTRVSGLTPEPLNVNLAYALFPPFDQWFGFWTGTLLNWAFMAVCVASAHFALQRWWLKADS